MRLAKQVWDGGDRLALLVHGLFGDAASWHRVAPALNERGYTVVACDLRGHGNSARGRYTPADWAFDLAVTFPRGADLAIGHSLGGLCLGLAAEALEVQRAVYLDPAWRMTDGQSADFAVEWRSWLDWTSINQLRAALGSTWPEDDLELRWKSMARTDPAVIPGLATGTGYDYSPETITSSALVVRSDPSQFITPEHEADLRSRGIDVESIANSGHSVFREDLPALLNVLDRWLDSNA